MGDLLKKVSRETFISDHVLVCSALPAKKYDEKKACWATHSLEYSRRKCAKNLWRKQQKQISEVPNRSLGARDSLPAIYEKAKEVNKGLNKLKDDISQIGKKVA